VHCLSLLLLQSLLVVLRLKAAAFELRFQVTDAHVGKFSFRIPIERPFADGNVAAVGSIDRAERRCAVFYSTTDWSNLVHRPTESHCAITADAAIRRTQ